MSGEEAPQLNGASGLLRANRNKSYGSLVRSQLSPVRQRRVEHRIQPGETLQGLALKYGVTVSPSESLVTFRQKLTRNTHRSLDRDHLRTFCRVWWLTSSVNRSSEGLPNIYVTLSLTY